MLLISIHNIGRSRPRPIVSIELDTCHDDHSGQIHENLKKDERRIVPLAQKVRLTDRQKERMITSLLENLTISQSSTLPQHQIGRKTSWSDGVPTYKHLPPIAGVSDQAFSRIRARKEPRKRVTFTEVHIREHAITVGDHDWCEGSLPIQLDWQHTASHSIPLDDFEWQRERQGRTPRGHLPKLDHTQRKRLLRRVAGITEEDLFLLERQHIDSKYVTLQRSKIVTLFPNKTR